ncbi:cytochrome P450 family protein [Amycolatopsis panacis]|uniref:Cytochrome P450 n=1 Tax=Amycolatopsis panacis TaxID=2340917 RepID=A0A419I7S1_9PSEU|nr:cytochrome P450 [Amycolatopsis panacis]
MSVEVPEDLPTLDELLLQNAHGRLAELRGPACPFGNPWGYVSHLVTGYEDARTLLADPRLSKDQQRVDELIASKLGLADSAAGAASELTRNMLTSDPPNHTRLRKLVNKAFTPRTVARLRPRIEQLTRELLDEMAGREQVDLMTAFALPLPIAVICELLGVDPRDRGDFVGWSNTVLSGAVDVDAMNAAAGQLYELLAKLVEDKRADPGEDMLSELIQVSEEGDRLAANELVGMAFLLLSAGYETTVNLIGNATLALLRAPDQAAKLRADPSLLPGAVEEFLRYDGPINLATTRFTTEEVEVGGATIAAGEFVEISLLAANRDADKFPDPDELDVTRAAGGHLAFGHGIHYCVGAPLARMEAEIALGGLLSRFPDLALAVPEEELRYRTSPLVHGLESLPVRLGTARS